MKKSILISTLVLTTFGLAAMSMINWDKENIVPEANKHPKLGQCAKPEKDQNKPQFNQQTAFVYDVNTRFRHTITIENLFKAKSILDIVPQWKYGQLSDFKDVKVTIYHDKTEISEDGVDITLNQNQLDLLKKLNYSTNFYITAHCSRTDSITGLKDKISVAYYISVIPEQIVQYSEGIDGLHEYLKEQSQLETAYVAVEKLNPGKIYFIVNEAGQVVDSKIESSCGNLTIDSKMLNLINNLPGTWEPARNAKGQKISQGLVYSYAQMGC